MFEPRLPRYGWGERVVALCDLVNDGTYPGAPGEALLVARGSTGEIVRIGHHEEANAPVYLIDFGTHVVGCLEEEIARPVEVLAGTAS